MKKDIELKGIGKNTPFEAPEGFFEQVSENTLRKAKLREQKQKRSLTFWRTMAVAASLAAVVLLVYFIDEPPTHEKAMTVQEIQPLVEPVIETNSEILKEPIVASVKKDSVKKGSPEIQKAESMTDILAELSDEELIQLAAMFKSDPFFDEAMQ